MTKVSVVVWRRAVLAFLVIALFTSGAFASPKQGLPIRPVDRRDPLGNTALINAAANGEATKVNRLIAQGASLDLKNNAGETALMRAALQGTAYDAEQRILPYDVHSQWRIPFKATGRDFAGCVKALLDAGADANIMGANLEALGRGPRASNRGWNALMIASYNGNVGIVEMLVKAGARVNDSDDYLGYTPLVFAACCDDVRIAKVLIAAGALVEPKDENSRSAMHKAAQGGYLDFMALLIAHGAEPSGRALEYALESGLTDSASMMMTPFVKKSLGLPDIGHGALVAAARGRDVDCFKLVAASGARDLLKVPAIAGDVLSTALWVEDDDSLAACVMSYDIPFRSPEVSRCLFQAIRYTRLATFRRLVQSGAQVNVRDDFGRTPLVEAAEASNAKFIMELIAAGADINLQAPAGENVLFLAAANSNPGVFAALVAAGSDVKVKNAQGVTTLMRAMQGAPETVKALIAAGVDVNANDQNGATALMTFGPEYPLKVRMLVYADAIVNARDNKGETALMKIKYGGEEAARALIANGANVNAKDRAGKSVLWHVKNTNDRSLVAILTAAGAR
ncbi:MAG TPA: ankyrin repeat domain-containing protein [Capsulimonadaceae bacterium]|jgi:ankyrin repeat protein